MPDDLSKTDYEFRMVDAVVGAQMMFVAFGALVFDKLSAIKPPFTRQAVNSSSMGYWHIASCQRLQNETSLICG